MESAWRWTSQSPSCTRVLHSRGRPRWDGMILELLRHIYIYINTYIHTCKHTNKQANIHIQEICTFSLSFIHTLAFHNRSVFDPIGNILSLLRFYIPVLFPPQAPSLDDRVDLHFVAFAHVDGRLLEFGKQKWENEEFRKKKANSHFWFSCLISSTKMVASASPSIMARPHQIQCSR